MKAFDRKFGAELLRDLPPEPAVYLFRDASGRVLYAGKAKNVRRRLQSYRNAGRRKVHRKMRKLVRLASELEVRLQPSEQAALLLENELIRQHRPPYNVDGAFHFLYPAIGIRSRREQLLLVFSSQPGPFSEIGLCWYGVFRSRGRAREAFAGLLQLLGHLGHREPPSRLRELPRIRGTSRAAFRRVDELAEPLEAWLAGESSGFVELLSLRLLDKPAARRDAAAVAAVLRCLADFYETDARPLRDALRNAGRAGGYVAHDERDALFIRARTSSARRAGRTIGEV